MDLIDEGQMNVDQSEVRYFPTALKYGLIGAGVSIAFSLISNLFGLVDYTGESSNWLVNLINTAITILIIVLAIQAHRDIDLGGRITFGRAFAVGFSAIMIAGAIGAVWAVVYFGLIDPGILDVVRDAQMTAMEDRGMSESEMEAAEGMMGFFTSPIFFGVVAIFMSAIAGGIISLISAAIMKKE